MAPIVLAVSGDAVAKAVDALRMGHLVVYPTETFYGLGAAALTAEAVRRAAMAKGRAEGKPFPLIVSGWEMAGEVAAQIPPWARDLGAAFWPGPLTLVLKARPGLPAEVKGPGGTVGIRVSSHPWAHSLVERAGIPVTATSANRSGQTPPVTATGAARELGDAVSLVLDGGHLTGTTGSTVVDVTVFPPVIIREGAIPTARLAAVWAGAAGRGGGQHTTGR